jgi:hypothetical protein
LRYRPVVNAKEIMTMRLDLGVKTYINGAAMPSNVPSSITTMETTVNRIDPNGDIHYGFRYVSVAVEKSSGVQPAVLEKIRSQFKKLEGITGTAIVDSRGQTKSFNLKLPSTVDPGTAQLLEQLQQSLKNIAVGLPAEPLGVGAKWRVSQPIEINRIKMTGTAVYELVSLEQGGATIKVAVEQQGQGQRLTLPNLPPNLVINLTSLDSKGQGDVVLRWNRITPIQSTLAIASKMNFQISQPGRSQPMPFQSETTVKLAIQGR